MVERTLQARVDLVDVVMLGAGSALGASVFAVLAPATRIGGSGILLTIALAALPMVVFGSVYAVMASIAPRTGASFEWPREYINPFAGFMVAWLRILGQVGQMVTLATVLFNFLGLVIELPSRPVTLALFCGLLLLNLRGIAVAARAQTVLMCLFILVLATFVFTGIPHVRVERIVPLLPQGWLPVLLAVPLLANLFMGIESVTEIGEEVKNSKRNVPLGIGIALCLISVIYVSVCFVALGLIGAQRLGAATAPLVVAAQQSIGLFAKPLIVTGAVLSLLKSLNATYLLFARSLFVLGRAGLLSPRLGRVGPRHGVPRTALLVAFVCACAGLLLPHDLIFLFVASSIPTVLKYLMTCISALRLAARRDELARARSAVPRGLFVGLAWLGIACAGGILALAFADDWRASVLIAVWAVCGLSYWWMSGARAALVPANATGCTRNRNMNSQRVV